MTGEKDTWGKGLWTELPQKTKGVKIRVPRMNVHQKVTFTEKVFNNKQIG